MTEDPRTVEAERNTLQAMLGALLATVTAADIVLHRETVDLDLARRLLSGSSCRVGEPRDIAPVWLPGITDDEIRDYARNLLRPGFPR